MRMQPSAALLGACTYAPGLASRDVQGILRGQLRVEDQEATASNRMDGLGVRLSPGGFHALPCWLAGRQAGAGGRNATAELGNVSWLSEARALMSVPAHAGGRRAGRLGAVHGARVQALRHQPHLCAGPSCQLAHRRDQHRHHEGAPDPPWLKVTGSVTSCCNPLAPLWPNCLQCLLAYAVMCARCVKLL